MTTGDTYVRKKASSRVR